MTAEKTRTLTDQEIQKMIADAIKLDREQREFELLPEEDRKRCEMIARRVVKLMKSEPPPVPPKKEETKRRGFFDDDILP